MTPGEGYRKRCARCKTVKPGSAFSRSSSAKDGLQSWCKDCTNSYVRPSGEGTPAVVSRPKRGKRRAEFERWLLTGITEGYVSAVRDSGD